jgi:hypothetical protein
MIPWPRSGDLPHQKPASEPFLGAVPLGLRRLSLTSEFQRMCSEYSLGCAEVKQALGQMSHSNLLMLDKRMELGYTLRSYKPNV